MLGNKFWRQVEITPADVVQETRDYLLVVTPTLWREQARAETDRQLREYSIVHKAYGCVETGADNLSTALMTIKNMQTFLDELAKEEGVKTDENIVRLVPKDPTK